MITVRKDEVRSANEQGNCGILIFQWNSCNTEIFTHILTN